MLTYEPSEEDADFDYPYPPMDEPPFPVHNRVYLTGRWVYWPISSDVMLLRQLSAASAQYSFDNNY